jgi:hypothetical protein
MLRLLRLLIGSFLLAFSSRKDLLLENLAFANSLPYFGGAIVGQGLTVSTNCSG